MMPPHTAIHKKELTTNTQPCRAPTIPKSFTQWLKEGRDFGALADGIAGCTSPEYEFLKEFALSEKLKLSDRDM